MAGLLPGSETRDIIGDPLAYGEIPGPKLSRLERRIGARHSGAEVTILAKITRSSLSGRLLVRVLRDGLTSKAKGGRRMRIGRRCGVNLAVLFCAAAALAQQVTTRPQVEEPSKSAVFLDVVVTRKNGGAPLAGLTQQDFTVTDNNAPQAITLFRAVDGSEVPVAMTVVIDAVNTAFTTVAFERNQIGKFFKANNGNMAYPTQLAIFTDTGMQIQAGFTKDGNALSASLDHSVVGLREIKRSAGFYGAAERLQLSIQTLEQLAQHEATQQGRKLVLWVSPGWPILEGPRITIGPKQQQGIFDTITGLSTALRQARVTLYSIDPLGMADAGGFQHSYYEGFVKGVRKPGQTGFGNLALQVIATQTGGLVLNSGNDVAALLDRAVADSKAFYELSFDPVKGEPDEYHQIEVKVGKPGLIARTRTGYYSGK